MKLKNVKFSVTLSESFRYVFKRENIKFVCVIIESKFKPKSFSFKKCVKSWGMIDRCFMTTFPSCRIPVISSKRRFDSLFWNIFCFHRKIENAIWFISTWIRKSTYFADFRMKLTTWISQKAESLYFRAVLSPSKQIFYSWQF